MLEIGNSTNFEQLDTDTLIALLRMMLRQHIRQHDSVIAGVLRQFADKCETELAVRAAELSNFEVASICHDLSDYLQRASDVSSMEEELKLILLLSELRENVMNNIKVYSIGELLSVYCGYVQSLFFTASATKDGKRQ